MKNKEKYAKEIVEIACEGNGFAVSKETGKPVRCVDMRCSLCAINLNEDKYKTCTDYRKEWAESEYIKRPVISKNDRVFLGYLDTKINYITRDREILFRGKHIHTIPDNEHLNGTWCMAILVTRIISAIKVSRVNSWLMKIRFASIQD